jgi:hypothetical protein
MRSSSRSKACGPCQLPPAQVIAHAVFRNIAQRVVERLDAHGAAGAESLKPHADANTVPQGGQPGVVDLKNEAGGDDRLVFDAHGFGDGEHIVLITLVETIAPVDFEARRRGGGEEYVLGSGGRDRQLDLLLERSLADVSDRPGADLYRALLVDLCARHIEQRAALAGVTVKVGELLAVPALLDQRFAFGGLDVGEAAEAGQHVAQPVAALSVFAFIDDIDANAALLHDDGPHIIGEPRFVAGRNARAGR